MEHHVKKTRSLVGTVVSNKMRKTAVVEIERTKRHPKYLKAYAVTRRFKCHDEQNLAKPGDRVEIEETRPLSREKRWRIVKILTNNKQQTTDNL